MKHLNIVFSLLVLIMSTICSCSKDAEDENGNKEKTENGTGNQGEDIEEDDEEEEGPIASLSALDYTVDGYFDGVLYYQITSNADNTVEVAKGSASASVVVIPKHVIINGTTYSITGIRERAFYVSGYGNKNLSSLIISNTVKYIGKSAFSSCSNLASVVFGRNVEEIGDESFRGCPISRIEFPNLKCLYKLMLEKGLLSSASHSIRERKIYIEDKEFKELTIPDGFISICNGAFKGCSGLTSVNIPNSVTSIGYSAFSGCSSLTSIIIKSDIPPAIIYYSYPELFDSDLLAIYVPQESLEAYKNADGWNIYRDIIQPIK